MSNATKYIFPETEGSAFAGLRHYMDKSTCSYYVSEGKKGENIEEGSREEDSKNYFEPFLMVQLDELCWLWNQRNELSYKIELKKEGHEI